MNHQVIVNFCPEQLINRYSILIQIIFVDFSSISSAVVSYNCSLPSRQPAVSSLSLTPARLYTKKDIEYGEFWVSYVFVSVQVINCQNAKGSLDGKRLFKFTIVDCVGVVDVAMTTTTDEGRRRNEGKLSLMTKREQSSKAWKNWP